MAQNSKYDFDGTFTFHDAVNSGIAAENVGLFQASRAINMTFRDGYVGPRPSIRKVDVAWGPEIQRGRFQGNARENRTGKLTFAVDGHIYQFDPSTSDTRRITDQVVQRDPCMFRLFFTETCEYMIVNDGKRLPVLISNTQVSETDPDLPSTIDVGQGGQWGPFTHGVFSQGYLSGALSGTNSFVVSDPSVPGRAEDNYLWTTLTEYLNGGGYINVGTCDECITAMFERPVLNTPTGTGGLLVATRDAIYANDLSRERDSWGYGGFQTKILSRGVESADSVITVNNDIRFRNRDGVYSINHGLTEDGSRIFLSLSKGNSYWMRDDDPTLLRYTVGSLWNNRSMMSTRPRQVILDDGRIDFVWDALAVWDHDLNRTVRSEANEVSEGIWTGLQWMGIAKTPEQLFFFAKDSDGNNALYELMDDGYPNSGYDYAGDREIPIEQVLYPKAYTFKTPFNRKSLKRVDLYIKHVVGQAEYQLGVRGRTSECWSDITDRKIICQTSGYEGVESCHCEEDIPVYPSGHFPQNSAGFIEEPGSRESWELRIRKWGPGQIEKLRISATNKELEPGSGSSEDENQGCEGEPCCGSDEQYNYRMD